MSKVLAQLLAKLPSCGFPAGIGPSIRSTLGCLVYVPLSQIPAQRGIFTSFRLAALIPLVPASIPILTSSFTINTKPLHG